MVLIRREAVSDAEAVRAVTLAAFTERYSPHQVPPEPALLDELRADAGWLPALSLVAAGPGGEVIGHVVCTRGHITGHVAGQAAPALGLGPLSVHPAHQRRGVGSALMHAVLGAADALDEPLVALLGEPGYYARFGFRPAAEHHITAPDPAWGPYFQVRTLTAHDPQLRGTFRYAEPFRRL